MKNSEYVVDTAMEKALQKFLKNEPEEIRSSVIRFLIQGDILALLPQGCKVERNESGLVVSPDLTHTEIVAKKVIVFLLHQVSQEDTVEKIRHYPNEEFEEHIRKKISHNDQLQDFARVNFYDDYQPQTTSEGTSLEEIQKVLDVVVEFENEYSSSRTLHLASREDAEASQGHR